MNEPRWLDVREAAVWKKYRDLQRQLQSALDRQLARDSVLSGADYAVLVPLSESPGDVLRARELQVELGWERSRLSHQISRMETRGMVAREPCEDDARGSMVRMTAQGRAARAASPPLARSKRWASRRGSSPPTSPAAPTPTPWWTPQASSAEST
ncbi:MarR family winged helix-turn-helix transcriptional regulator [Streptomyces sp. NBC_00873]|uniref:MarR family winged helix-turn-helix transcriptional regulator n=1 Tax=unclassified Streptomyces TaxID=2593676 RepID=UPI00386625FF|nr:MarR family winged helix-turn-helix transcriptional regulator [Streptomyces sp. NBC_00873]WTA48173.1 MarR family winged helix-turn-helix transcriptional regulator [Streptomyces sp. NBC_00842]